MFDLRAAERFIGRRSAVIVTKAAAATSQPLATHVGVDVLRSGGSAADAALAIAAMLQVMQPCSTGLGGDAFWLYFDASTNTVVAYNGSGRAPAALTHEHAAAVAEDGRLPALHPFTVTVPGAADAWQALHDHFGRLGRGRCLEQAIRAAHDGFPVAPMTSRWWASGAEKQLSHHEHGVELMIDGRAPRAGELFVNRGLARVLESFAERGAEPFYDGWIAKRIAEVMASEEGVLTQDDLRAHTGELVTPLSLEFGRSENSYRVWECPPNGQGLAALIALGIYERTEIGRAARDGQTGSDVPDLGAERVHAQVEAMRLAFADAAAHVADPPSMRHAPQSLLSEEYLQSRASQIDPAKRSNGVAPGMSAGSDTVYFCVVDSAGNACSFINSNYMGFGTGIVPRGCGFTLQNRGHGFVLEPGHPNCLAPGKRPYHTIIPGLVTRGAFDQLQFYASFGVMGGMMQPQGHLQVVSALLHDRLDPQSALDAPRFSICDGDPEAELLLEDSMPRRVVDGAGERGHQVRLVSGFSRSLFGMGQMIVRDGQLWAGSDSRGDGCAGGF